MANDPKVALAATIKDTDVDGDCVGLQEFHTNYFGGHDIYQDEKWQIYKAMGGRKIGLFGLVKAVLKNKRRWNRKDITPSENMLKTDPWLTGGVMIFDNRGNLVYAVEETVGEELSMDRIARAVQGARNINAACAAGDCDDEEEDPSTEENTETETSRPDS